MPEGDGIDEAQLVEAAQNISLDFPQPQWWATPPMEAARAFVVACMCARPADRPTAGEARQLAWLSSVEAEAEAAHAVAEYSEAESAEAESAEAESAGAQPAGTEPVGGAPTAHASEELRAPGEVVGCEEVGCGTGVSGCEAETERGGDTGAAAAAAAIKAPACDSEAAAGAGGAMQVDSRSAGELADALCCVSAAAKPPTPPTPLMELVNAPSPGRPAQGWATLGWNAQG